MLPPGSAGPKFRLPGAARLAGWRGGRWLALILLLALAIPGYAALISLFDVQITPIEEAFPLVAELQGRALSLYAELLTVDAVREVLEVRLSPAPEVGLRGVRLLAPDRDVTLRVEDGSNIHEMVLAVNQPMQPTVRELDLAGDTIVSYPFDAYKLTVRVSSFEGMVSPGEAVPNIPVSLRIWEGMPAWIVSTHSVRNSSDPVREVEIRVRRSGAARFLAVAMYVAMSVIGCAALTLGVLVFLGVRRMETTLTGALGAMVFALPALRNVMPGAPPLGVRADILVFLWAELAVVVGLALFVWRWARSGPSP